MVAPGVTGRLMTGLALPWDGAGGGVVFGFIEPVNSATDPSGFALSRTFHRMGQKC